MANNELDATFNLLAKDDGLATSINAGLAGLEKMLGVARAFNEQINLASKSMAQLRTLERTQTKAAPNERAIVGNQKTADTIVRATTIAQNQARTSTAVPPAQQLAATIARREQNLPTQTGKERAAAALQLNAARELQTQLQGVNREADKANTAMRRLTVPVTPATLASYDKLREEIADIERRLGNNIQRGRFTAAQNLASELSDKNAQIAALPASNRTQLAQQEAAAREAATLNRRGIQQLEATQSAEVKERERLNRTGIQRLEALQAADAKERERLNRQGIARLEADARAEAKIHAAEMERQRKQVEAASPTARINKANASRQNVGDNLFGDGGVSFATRIAGSYGIFQAVNGFYTTLFGTLGLLKDFDSELANLKGIAGATDGQMASLAKTILDTATNLDVGRFSLTELTKASTELAQAGFSTKEIQDSLQGFALLAAASGSDLAQSVDVGTAALGSFQLRADETGHVADVMASSLNLTKLTMDKLGQGLQYVGTTAYESNLTLEETVALLGGLAQSGIRSGSTLGTGLRQFLVDLKDPTEKLQGIMKRLGLSMDDIDVKAHGVTGVMQRLAKAGFGASDAYQGLEVRAAAAFLALRNQLPMVEELQRSFVGSGAAARAAAAQMGSFAAQSSLGINQLGALAVKATAPLVVGLTDVIHVANELLSTLNGLPDGVSATLGVLGTGVVFAVLVRKIRELVAAFLESRAAALSSAESLKALVAAQQEAAASAQGMTVAEYEAATSKAGLAAAAREAALAEEAQAAAALSAAQANAAAALAAADAAVAESELALAIAKANVGWGEEAAAATGAEAAVARAGVAMEACTLASTELMAAQARLAVASEAVVAGEGAAAVATGGFAAASGVLSTALTFLGGPLGLIIIAVTGLPLLFDALGISSSGAAKRMDELQTAVNETKGKIDAYDATIVSVEQEVQRLTDKSADLTANKAQLGEEVVRLTGRFTGLSSEINGTETSVEGLIAGMERLIVAQRKAQLGQLVAQGIQLDLQSGEARSQNDALARSYGGGVLGINNKSFRFGASGAAQQRGVDIITGRIAVDAAQLPAELEKLKAAVGQSAGIVADFSAYVRNQATISSNNEARRGLIGSKIDQGRLQTSSGYSRLEAALPQQAARFNSGQIKRADYAAYLKDQVSFFDAELAKPYNQKTGNQAAILEIRNKANDALQALYKGDADKLAADTKTQKGADAAQRKADAAKRKSEAAANKARSELYVNKESDSELKALEAEARLPTSYADLAQKQAEYDRAAHDYVVGKMEQAKDELAKKTGLSDAEQADYLAQAKSDAENRVRQFYAKVNSSVTKGLQNTLDAALKAIDDAAAVAAQPGKLRLARIDGQIAGLDNPSVRSKVPDYTQAYLKLQRDREVEAQRPQEINRVNAQIDAVQARIPDAELGLTAKDAAARTQATLDLAKLNQTLRDLQVTREGLIAQGDVSVIPTDLKTGLTQAADVWREQNGAADTFSEMLVKNVGGAFDTVTSSANTFFTDILSGNKSVLASFSNFVGSMISMLEQLVVKFAVTKLFNFALGAITGTPAANFDGGEIGAPSIKRIKGGRVYDERSGLVSNGEAGRDSVNTDLARGEFVTRKKAVDAVGATFMNDLNNRGAAALKDRTQPVIVAPPAAPPPSPVNVWLALPEEQPQMGPRDVLATVHRDILDGGQTKKLIQSVNR